MSDEALIRIEYKLDLIIRALQDKGLMLKGLPSLRGLEQDACPVCEQKVRIEANYAGEKLVRTCGCTPPVRIVPGISKLTQPPEEGSHGSRERGQGPDEVPPDEAPRGSGGG